MSQSDWRGRLPAFISTAALLLAAVLILVVVPVLAAPAPACRIGPVAEIDRLADGALQALDRPPIDRLLAFFGRAPHQADRAWQGEAQGHVLVIFAKAECVVGITVMDRAVFEDIAFGKPI